jgi:uncharacterized short protein YbdD (DUF466 family)
MKQRLLELWNLVRALATDDAYERYLDHHRLAHAEGKPMARREFYLRQQINKWSGVSRCC